MTRAAVMGTGSWGTAFAAVLADAGTDVVMWGRRPDSVAQINAGRNTDYLPDLHLPDRVSADTDALAAMDGADIVVLAVPSQTLRANLAAWCGHIPGGAAVVSLMKGIELGTMMRMSEVIADTGCLEAQRIVVVSGPNLAGEIARKQPAASVVACTDHDTAAQVAQACSTAYFRPYIQTDVIGTELGGAVKNVVALAVGMAEGMGLGDNTKSTIITRGLAETARLGLRLGADPTTFLGLAGVGDLIATCMSPLSRNRTFGVRLGQGRSVGEVIDETRQTAEGVKSCHSVQALARAHGVEMPITDAVVSVIDGQMAPSDLGRVLMSRSIKHERA